MIAEEKYRQQREELENQRQGSSEISEKQSKLALTWLPSFCQKTAGCGFPLVSQGNVTVRP